MTDIVFEFLAQAAIAAIVLLILKYYYNKRKIFTFGSKLPGPRPWPIIGNAWDFLNSDVDILVKLRKYQGYKKLFKLWLGHDLNVFVFSPDFAEIFCQSNKLLQRTDKLKFLNFISGRGLLLANGAEWKKARKLVESGLSYTFVKNSISVFQIHAELLTERLQDELGKPCFSILKYAEECALDIISHLSFGYDLKLSKSKFLILDIFDEIAYLIRRKIFNALYQWDYLYKIFPEGKKFYSDCDKLLNSIDSIATDVKKTHDEEKKIVKNKENSHGARKKFFVETLLDDETLSFSEAKEHVISVLAGGFETTSSALSFALVMLALHPDVQEKAYQEVKSIVDDGNFSDDKIQQLKYLEMVIKEVLRLFPTVPLTFRKATEDIEFGEYLIPEGAEVSLNIYQLHRDPEQYDNPNEFNPDNFLPENIAKRHPYSFIPFLKGARNCVGGKLAMIVLKVVISKLLSEYKVECDYKSMNDIKFRGEVSIHLIDDGLIRILRRQ